VHFGSATQIRHLDHGADPRGEFLAAVHAAPAYSLFNYEGLGAREMPPPDTPIGRRIGYHMRTGEHNITAYDWEQFMNFLDRALPAPAAAASKQ
jgi:hypothetical protein